jgi:hypothetical protein
MKVKEWMGHSNVETTEGYTHEIGQHLDGLQASLEGLLGRAVNPVPLVSGVTEASEKASEKQG